MGKHLQLIGTIVPLVIVAVGLIGFALTLRSDITAAQAQMVEVRRELQVVGQASRQTEIEINKLNKLIKDFDEIEAITEEVDVLDFVATVGDFICQPLCVKDLHKPSFSKKFRYMPDYMIDNQDVVGHGEQILK